MNNLVKIFYTLKELSPLVNIKYRQLQERIKIVKIKYEDRSDLIFKKSNIWCIHHSLIKEFARKRKPIDYQLFVTIASSNNFDRGYWKYIIFRLNQKIKDIDTSTRTKYVIELKDNFYHLHFMTTFCKFKQLRSLIKNDFFTNNSNDMNTYIQYVTKVKGLHKYFRKQYKPVLLK